jgi:hypothetical protein
MRHAPLKWQLTRIRSYDEIQPSVPYFQLVVASRREHSQRCYQAPEKFVQPARAASWHSRTTPKFIAGVRTYDRAS